MVARILNGLEILKKTAINRGGICLSDSYKGVDKKYSFRCKDGHEWIASYYSVVNRKSWCPYCAKIKVNPATRIQDAKNYASSQGGDCLSFDYKSTKENLVWRCKNKHVWEASFSNTVNHKKWCPWCAGNKVDANTQFERALSVAAKQGGRCLSKEYLGNKRLMSWECEKGHIWSASFASVLSRGSWCGICRGTQRPPHEQIEKAKRIAESRNGELLSKDYIKNSASLIWQCSRGHKWPASFDSVARGSWCPACSSGLKERIARNALEQLFDLPFPKKKPKWLVNPKTNRLLELDGYNEELKLAFEYHGPQHYKVVLPFKMNTSKLEASKYRDALKRELCKKHDVQIIEIPFTVESEEMLEWISTYIQSTPSLIHLTRIINDWKRLTPNVWTESENYSIESLKQHAAKRGGTCLSETYLGALRKHRWMCSHGHSWNASWDSLKNSKSWCPVCSGNVLIDPIKELQKIAKSKGGVCLSEKYINAKTKLRWRCKNKHEWEATPSHIRNSGSWCRICSAKNRKLNS